MSSATSGAPTITSIHSAEPLRQKKFPWVYLEGVTRVFKTFPSDQTIAVFGPKILRYIQPASFTPMQYANDQYAKSSRAANVYYKPSLTVTFITGVDSSAFNSLREY